MGSKINLRPDYTGLECGLVNTALYMGLKGF